MRIESDGHSRGNPRLYELIEHAPKTGKSPTVWAWPELIDYLKVAGQPVAGPWPPHQEPRPDPEEDSLPVAVADPESRRPAPAAPGDPAPDLDPEHRGCPHPPYLLRYLEDPMYPSRFRYEAPRSLDEAISLLHDGGDYVKVLAGGQSLVPMMKLRFASPELIVDINNVPGLDYHRADPDGTLRIGALCRHADLERSDLLKTTQPTMAAAAPLIADPIVRNRGTLVGSLCHADPQGDWASVVLALGGSVVARGPRGTRTIPLADFVTGPFQNVLDQDEIAVEAVIPAAKGVRSGGYLKLERRVGDFATVGVAVAVETSRRERDQGGHRPDRGRRLHHRGHRGGRSAGRAAADRRQHRAGRRTRGAGRAAEDRSSRQRRIQAAHGAHLRDAHPERGADAATERAA